MSDLMTDDQAYAAMFKFLHTMYQQTESDELGGLLGSLALLPDGFPADPAVKAEWKAAVKYALAGGKPDGLGLRN